MKSINSALIFRFVWRINGIAILAILCISLCYMTVGIFSNFSSGRNTTNAISPDLAPKEEGKPQLRLGEFTQVGSSNILRADLFARNEGGFSSIKGGAPETHNTLFIDSSTGKSWWLLPNSESIIESTKDLTDSKKIENQTIANVYLVSTTNNETKSHELILSDTKGQKKITLAKGEITLESCISISPTEAKIIYYNSKSYYSITINPSEISKTSELPIEIKFHTSK